jgi:hypothetical protein
MLSRKELIQIRPSGLREKLIFKLAAPSSWLQRTKRLRNCERE